MAAFTFIKPLAGIGGHEFYFFMAACGAADLSVAGDSGHFYLQRLAAHLRGWPDQICNGCCE